MDQTSSNCIETSLKNFKVFQNETQNQLGKINDFWLDYWGEYLSRVVSDHLSEHENVSELVPLGKLEWNGVSKRGYQTLLDVVWHIMNHRDLPLSIWVLL